jgi:putative oxygen-independent coproporphyrinogen III oxidase
MNTSSNEKNNTANQLLVKQKELSLYIHIPFCRQKCSYCNFYSLPVSTKRENTLSIEKTCERIFLEIDKANSIFKKCYKTVFIGGGNPGILSKELLEKLLLKISENGKPSEITVECNPENINNDLIFLFQQGLATRLSTGIQSLSENLLRNIGRNCAEVATVRHALKNHNLISRTWDLNIDLIVGIPDQSIADVKNDIDEIIELVNPEHFSIYDLTYEPGTPLYNQYISQMDELQESSEEMLPEIWEYMKDLGYNQYEISNFARKTDGGYDTNFCKHNIQYWEMKPYLGIGPGAASTLFNGNNALRIECSPNVEKYQSCTTSLLNTDYLIESLSYDDYLKEKLIMGLRLFSGINLVQIEKIFDIVLTEVIPKTINSALQKKIIVIQDNWLKFSQNGIMFMNSILVDMFIEIENYFSTKQVHNSLDLTAVFELC